VRALWMIIKKELIEHDGDSRIAQALS